MRFKGRPILGALSGFFLGFWAAILLTMFSISPLTTMTLIGLPAIGLVLGLGLAFVAPLGGGGDSATG